MKICVLGSSSGGNCTYLASQRTAILIDAGLSGRETGKRLAEIGVVTESIEAICLTHEHGDHTSGLAALSKIGRIRLYANSGTAEGVKAKPGLAALSWNIFSNGSPFRIGDLEIEPFSVPHDAYDPVGFVVRCGETCVGVVTDMGVVTGLIRERLRLCNALVIESNHDEQMVKDADRPWHLKQRIVGRQGHLSNAHAAELLAEIVGPHLKMVFLAHLSGECNRPDLALKAVTDSLRAKNATHVVVKVAPPDRISELWDG